MEPAHREFKDELDRMHHQGTRFARRLAYFAAVAFVLLSGITGWALYGRFEQTNSKRSAQHALNVRFAEVTRADCLEIERLKKNVRDQAIANLNNLQRNAKLLGIDLTPALRRQEAIDTEHTLRTYAAEPCPRPTKVAQ